MDKEELTRRFGAMGERLFHLSRGDDPRPVSLAEKTKSIGAETTFDADLATFAELERILWQLCQRVSARARSAGLAGSTVVLKLKTSRFRLLTRHATLSDPTRLATRIFSAARELLSREADGTTFRLIGVSVTGLVASDGDAEFADLDPSLSLRARAERAVDRVRDRFGRTAIDRGLGTGFSGPGSDDDLDN
jgi:DNA polymerase-4